MVVEHACLTDEELRDFINLWKAYTDRAFQKHGLSKSHPVLVPLHVLRLADRVIEELCMTRYQQDMMEEWRALDVEGRMS